MTLQGHVQNGVIILDTPANLPDGIRVRVELLSAVESDSKEMLPSLYERLKSVAGKAQDLPDDLADNHDHYIHGTPKR